MAKFIVTVVVQTDEDLAGQKKRPPSKKSLRAVLEEVIGGEPVWYPDQSCCYIHKARVRSVDID